MKLRRQIGGRRKQSIKRKPRLNQFVRRPKSAQVLSDHKTAPIHKLSPSHQRNRRNILSQQSLNPPRLLIRRRERLSRRPISLDVKSNLLPIEPRIQPAILPLRNRSPHLDLRMRKHRLAVKPNLPHDRLITRIDMKMIAVGIAHENSVAETNVLGPVASASKDG